MPAAKPADRSISPSSRTKTRPIARTMTPAPWLSRLAKLKAVEERRALQQREDEDEDDQAEDGRQRADVAAADLGRVVASRRRAGRCPGWCPRRPTGTAAVSVVMPSRRSVATGAMLSVSPGRRRCRASPLRPAVISSTTWAWRHLVGAHLRRHPARGRGRRCRSATCEDVVHVVRDEDDAEAVVGEPPDEVEDLLGLGDAERGGRLVEDDELAVPQHGAGDRDRLPLAAGQAGDLLAHRLQRCGRTGPSSVSRARCSIVGLVEDDAALARSRPRNMLWTTSRLSHSARSW